MLTLTLAHTRKTGLSALLGRWRRNARTRSQLRGLSNHMLRDVGLGPDAARIEADRPFWR